jgi:hypothetical protein
MQFSMSSKKDLRKVIHFFSNSNHHPLMGLKKVQYDQWSVDVHKKIGKVVLL